MAGRRACEALLSEVAAEIGLDDLSLDADGRAGVVVEGTTTVLMQHNERDETLVAYSIVGPLPANARSAAIELLLAANLLWRGTGGATLGLDQEDDTVLLAQRMAVGTTRPQELATVLKELADMAGEWRDILSNLAARSDGAEPQPADLRAMGMAVWG